MATDNLARLSRRLLASPLKEGGEVFLFDKDYIKQTATLEPAVRDQINGLIADIRSFIPTDFAFSLSCEFAGIRLSIDFEDGDTGSTAGGGFFVSRRSMMRKLRSIDWDELRGELIVRSEIFDQLLSEADDRPPNIPSSKEAALRNYDALTAEIEAVRAQTPVPPFAVIVTGDVDGMGAETAMDRDELVSSIADLMTTQCEILAVLERGVSWSFAEIEKAKLEAVELLGPISRAKAERRFLP